MAEVRAKDARERAGVPLARSSARRTAYFTTEAPRLEARREGPRGEVARRGGGGARARGDELEVGHHDGYKHTTDYPKSWTYKPTNEGKCTHARGAPTDRDCSDM